MASICKLPAETLLHIADYLDELRDVSSFSRVGNHHVHEVVASALYARVKHEVALMCWACDEGSLGTVQRLLDAGADPNDEWGSDLPRSYTIRNAMLNNLPASARWDFDDYRSLWVGMPADPPLNPDLRQEWAARKADYQEADDLDSLKDDDSDSDSDPGADAASTASNDEPSTSRINYDADRKITAWTRPYEWSPLHIAARWGHDQIIELLLDGGADVNVDSCGYCDCIYPTHWTRSSRTTPTHALDQTSWSPLHTAICHGQQATAKLLLARGARLNVAKPVFEEDDAPDPPAFVSPLHTACAAGATDIARFLIDELQIDIETKDHLGHTPMSYAYFTSMWECIDFLVERGATLNTRIGDWTLLKHACREARFAEALRLMELGASVHQHFDDTDPPTRFELTSALRFCCVRRIERVFTNVHVALRTKRQQHLRAEVVKQLMKPEQRTDAHELEWPMSLVEAARGHFPDVVRVFLEAGVGDQATRLRALQYALVSYVPSGPGSLPRTVEAILPCLEDARKTSNFTLRCVMDALGGNQSNRDKRAVLQLLLGQQQGKSLTRSMGKQIWGRAVPNYSTKLRDILLESGLEPPRQKDLPRLISKAIDADSAAALEYLFTLNAAPEPLVDGSHLFYTLAVDAMSCAQFLIGEGISTDYRSPRGDTCLLEACKIPSTRAARMLLDKGADPNLYGPESDDVPLVQAALSENMDLVRALLDHGASVHETDGHAGGLTFALFMGLEESAKAMIMSQSFKDASQEKRDEYIEIALAAPLRAWCEGRNLEYLLRFGGVDPNYMTNVGIPPLVGLFLSFRPNAVGLLKEAGAKIHKRLDRRPTARTNPEPTVLQLAISAADEDVVFNLLADEDLFCPEDGDGGRDGPDQLTPELAADYVRAASGRYNPLVIAALREHRLDFKRRDHRTGDTVVHMICQSLDGHILSEEAGTYGDDEDMEEAVVTNVAQAAMCLHYMVSELGVDPAVKNHLGVSGCDLVRQKINYQGPNSFLRKVAAAWGALMEVGDESIEQAPGGRARFCDEHNFSPGLLRAMEMDFRVPNGGQDAMWDDWDEEDAMDEEDNDWF